jgi:hypothetical protein
MPISPVIDSLNLDELATKMLPLPVIIAIDQVDIEYVLWERRRSMNTDRQHAVLPTTSSANERILPVVVLGDTVIPPRIQLQPLQGLRPGRSYNAIQAAFESNREILVVFVAESEIMAYKSSDPQPFPMVGVIAQLEEVAAQSDDTLQIVLDVTTRAIVTARLQHDPYWIATCIPHPDLVLRYRH